MSKLFKCSNEQLNLLKNWKNDFKLIKDACNFYAKEWGVTPAIVKYNIDKLFGVGKFKPKTVVPTETKPVSPVVEVVTKAVKAKKSLVIKPKMIAQLRQKGIIVINDNIRIEVPGNSVTINGDLISW